MAAERVDRLDVLEADLRKVIKMKPDYAHAYNALGYTLADKTRRLSEAKELIEKAYKLQPTIRSSSTAWAGSTSAWDRCRRR
jgi:Flp pilus assembly protein TadD